MEYTFDLIGVSPVLSFFSHQQEHRNRSGAAYLGTYRCTLYAFIESIEPIAADRNWHSDRAVDTVIEFWINHAEQVQYWKQRLEDAGRESLIVASLANFNSLRLEFEALLDG